MIKRRFYRYEHGDNDAASGESSSSDSEVEAAETSDESEDEQQQEENNAVEEVAEDKDNSSSGYESEDSSANEVNLDSSGSEEDELGAQNMEDRIVESLPRSKGKPTLAKTQNIPGNDENRFEATEYVLKCKSVFKCRICPRIVCMSEETINAHLKPKRHARSEKLLEEGRLKLMLNEKGQIEGDMLSDRDSDSEKEKGSDSEKDSDSERELVKPKRKKNKGRVKQKKRLKREKALKRAEKAAGSPAMNRKARRKNMQPK